MASPGPELKITVLRDSHTVTRSRALSLIQSTIPISHIHLLQFRLLEHRGIFLCQGYGSWHGELGALPDGTGSSSANTLPALLPQQVEDLTQGQEYTHQAYHHHEGREHSFLCWPREQTVKDELCEIVQIFGRSE